ncbi:MAG: Fe-S cluster assembly protein SufD [Paludibacteraceae bacterium]|nr:Fe-S cluster assembly protein SufD [Paludibacteraceae bacterium]MBQ4035662.1 Fe-S cluster assembly protein SufD [Paludibacteraceae bacterium]MBR6042231.1 Fe-S cluster assembly protein SufD [Paludibacteraceae bacterium]
MSVEQPYIDIYNQMADKVKAQSSAPLNALRDDAINALAERGFPTKKWEDFQRSDMRERYATNYGMNLTQFNIDFNPYKTFKCDIQAIKSHLFFVVNDVFYSNDQKALDEIAALQKQGIVAGSLRQVAKTHPELVAKYYGKAAKWDVDTTVAFNTAFAQDGFFIYVPKQVQTDFPIQIINVMNGDLDMMATSRNLVVVEEGAKLQLLVCGHTSKKYNYLCNRVTEVFVGQYGTLEMYKLEDTEASMTNIGSLFIEQQADSNVMVNEITLKNGFTRNNINVELLGEHAELNLCGMAIGDGDKHIDNHTFVNHAVGHCKTNELYKYILNEESVGSFDGKILVNKGSQKTEAYQSNRNIVVTPTAKMYTKPHLEIYADDVKCSHGATVGQLDKEALFYMQSRGIPEAEARMLLMVAFANDVIENIKIEALRTRMHMLVERRFRGETLVCNSCTDHCTK